MHKLLQFLKQSWTINTYRGTLTIQNVISYIDDLLLILKDVFGTHYRKNSSICGFFSAFRSSKELKLTVFFNGTSMDIFFEKVFHPLENLYEEAVNRFHPN
jgi:hypothetical protein